MWLTHSKTLYIAEIFISFFSKLGNKIKIKDILAAKDARLEELELKMIRMEELELKVIRLEEIIDSQREKEKIVSAVDERSVGRSVSFPRTCRELRAADPTLITGMHWIDPDGQGVGDDPIYVLCDMVTGR